MRFQPWLIPAHAGKTLDVTERAWLQRAHPRSRGENKALDTDAHPTQGSSPLTRGKQDDSAAVNDVPRLIPAHAGKTSKEDASDGDIQAHPRSRGENRTTARLAPSALGSSPLTRGKPTACVEVQAMTRLIPAHAGKTCPTRRRGRSPGAHPRSRGENGVGVAVFVGAAGSSPLTRGKRDQSADT